MAHALTFVHLSDLHIAPPGRRVFGIDPLPQMRAVLDHIRTLAVAPAFVVISGDLTDDGSAASYEELGRVLRELDGIPVLLALGNHDDRATFRQITLGGRDGDAGRAYRYSREIDGLRVVVLDSVIPGQTGGELGAPQLAWLESELQRPAPRGALIVLHHPCRLAGPARHRPDFILRDAEALEAIVVRHASRVVGVLAGHSHQANAAPLGGALHVTAPAVLVQLDFFAGDEYAPLPGAGLNLCQLDDDGLVVNPMVLDPAG